MPYTDGVYPGFVTCVVGGGRVWVEHPREKEMFRVDKHLLYASHAAAVTHWEQQNTAATAKKVAAKPPKKKPNPKPDADPPAEPAPGPQSLTPGLRLSRPPALAQSRP